jgi:hypothetical protein
LSPPILAVVDPKGAPRWRRTVQVARMEGLVAVPGGRASAKGAAPRAGGVGLAPIRVTAPRVGGVGLAPIRVTASPVGAIVIAAVNGRAGPLDAPTGRDRRRDLSPRPYRNM